MRRLALGIALGLVVFAAIGGAWYYLRQEPAHFAPAPPYVEPADMSDQVHQFCGKCHAYPPAESFPRFAWKEEVERGYNFFGKANLRLTPPKIDDVVRYYETRAPERLPGIKINRASTPLPVQFAPHRFVNPPNAMPPCVSHVNLVHLSDRKRLDILVCEMKHGLVMALRPYEPNPTWRILGKVTNPAHAEVIDLDGDGVLDIVVADLGSFPPTDRLSGSVVCLRGNKDGTFTPQTLFKDVGRVADVQAADFNGDGKLDLVVASFGWQEAGEIIVLENISRDRDHLAFKPHVVDKRHGAIHVPVIDLNKDGKPDFVALIAQEHEEVCAFVNQGNFKFQMKPLYTAPHPAYGSSGIQLVDLDGDGQTDVLYTNGDVLDSPHLLKPYHGLQWLRNKGNLEFEHRPIAAMYGIHRAVAADVTGNGRLDIVAVSYLPEEHFPQRGEVNADAIVLFEQTSPGQFVRHTVASKTCDHVACAVGDVFGTGRLDIVTANFTMNERLDSLVVLKNLGRAPHKK
ncbi:MAG: VCBS repeat-containing protein [Planctomycetes bacterium]|nr:VCBS repeat-containing protein [Planctomycetota bacterium]